MFCSTNLTFENDSNQTSRININAIFSEIGEHVYQAFSRAQAFHHRQNLWMHEVINEQYQIWSSYHYQQYRQFNKYLRNLRQRSYDRQLSDRST